MHPLAGQMKWVARLCGVLVASLCLMIPRDIEDTGLYVANLIPFFLVAISVVLGCWRPLFGAIGFFALAGVVAVVFSASVAGCLAVPGVFFMLQWVMQCKCPTRNG